MELTKRQREIIDVSIGLIADRGIKNLTTKNIALEIGISEPAIYRHFDNKQDIILAILDQFERIATDILDDLSGENMTSLEKVEHFMMDRYRCCAVNPKLAKVMFAEENFQDNEQLAAKVLSIMHRHKTVMQKVISEGQASGEIRDDIDTILLFRILFGPLRLLIKQWSLSGFCFNLEIEGKKLWEAEKKLVVNSV